MIKLWVLIFLFGFTDISHADTLYLKNGRTMEGLIKSDDGNNLVLEVCSGSISFRKSEIEKIDKSTPEEASAMQLKWEKQKQDNRKKLIMRQMEEDAVPKGIAFSENAPNIVLPVTLNKKIDVKLVLDTGASTIMLKNDIAKKLGIDIDKLKTGSKAMMADGRQVNASVFILESVKVEGIEAENVEAIILPQEGDISYADGLLGMSFLKRFNFKIDQKEKKLILEKFK